MRIPQYESKDRLVKEGSQIQESVAEVVNTGAGKQMQFIGAGIEDLGESIRKVENANAQSKADIEKQQWESEDSTRRDSLDTKDALLDLENVTQKKSQEIAKKYFSDPIGRRNWLRQQELNDASYIIRQKAKVAKKVVSERKVLTLRDLELAKSKYRNAEDEVTRMLVVDNIEQIANNPANNDIYTAEDRKKLVDNTIKQAEDDLKDVESLKRVKEKEFKLAVDEARNSKEMGYIRAKVSGQYNGMPVSKEDLVIMAKQDMDKGLISPEFADRYTTALKSPKSVKAKTIDKDFANIISDINSGTKSADTIRKNMLNDLSDGYLSEQDFASASTYLDMLADKHPEDLVAGNVRKAWFGLGGPIYSQDKEKEAESRARMSRSFINKLQQGVDAREAAIESTREEVLHLQPQAINYPNGVEVMDSHGVIKKVMPNGDIVEVEDKIKPSKK